MKIDRKRFPVLVETEFRAIDVVTNTIDRSEFKVEFEKSIDVLFKEVNTRQLIAETVYHHLLDKPFLRDKLLRFFPDALPISGWLLMKGLAFGYRGWKDEGESFMSFFVYDQSSTCIYAGIVMRPDDGSPERLHIHDDIDKVIDIKTIVEELPTEESLGGEWNREINVAYYRSLCFVIASIVVPFLKFAETETRIINASTGHKVIIGKEKYMTDLEHDIEIIDSRWFTEIVRTEGFNVSGHFRLQPYGPGRELRRLQWINAFEKHGYHRLATKDL